MDRSDGVTETIVTDIPAITNGDDRFMLLRIAHQTGICLTVEILIDFVEVTVPVRVNGRESDVLHLRLRAELPDRCQAPSDFDHLTRITDLLHQVHACGSADEHRPAVAPRRYAAVILDHGPCRMRIQEKRSAVQRFDVFPAPVSIVKPEAYPLGADIVALPPSTAGKGAQKSVFLVLMVACAVHLRAYHVDPYRLALLVASTANG